MIMQCQEILASELARISPIYDIVAHGSLGTADFSTKSQNSQKQKYKMWIVMEYNAN